MKYIIEIVIVDEEKYQVKNYFKSIFVDDYGTVKISTTTNPLEARMFTIIDEKAKSSIVNIIKNQLKYNSVQIKSLNYTIETPKND